LNSPNADQHQPTRPVPTAVTGDDQNIQESTEIDDDGDNVNLCAVLQSPVPVLVNNRPAVSKKHIAAAAKLLQSVSDLGVDTLASAIMLIIIHPFVEQFKGTGSILPS
jgi:hypothetical protein